MSGNTIVALYALQTEAANGRIVFVERFILLYITYLAMKKVNLGVYRHIKPCLVPFKG